MVTSPYRRSKLEPVYDGPYVVVGRTESGSYRVRDHDGEIKRSVPMHHMKLAERAPTKDPFEGIATVKRVFDHVLLADGTCEYRVRTKRVSGSGWGRFPFN